MIDPKKIDQDLAKLLTQIKRKFGIDADRLDKAMRKVGRRLPKPAHLASKEITSFAQKAGHPKLALQLRFEDFEKHKAALSAAIDSYDAKDARKGFWLGMLGSVVFNLILVFVLLIAFLVWRGLL